MPLKDELQREFYLTMAANERCSKRTLQAKIDGMLFERTAIATKPESVLRNTLLSYHPRKFSCANCKNHLRRQKRIIPPTDEREKTVKR